LKLSIIIPVFNEIDYLERFTERLIATFNNENVEYIIINDGSTDGSTQWLEKYKENYESKNHKNKLLLINLKKNVGKGFALKTGLESVSGDYVLFQDSDLELDPKDSIEMYQLIKNNSEMNVLFGSRFISGKLRANRYFINEVFVKLNSIIFNFLFLQSITDLHCGTKIITKEVIDKIKLKINDFGFEIDIASQVVKNNFTVYEFGISYFSRSKSEGKKITWIDGILCYYYLFKVRYLDNEISVQLSIIYSVIYMAYVGSYFSLGLGKIIVVIAFSIIGSFIGLYKKLFSSSIIFLFIYFGSLFSNGNGKIYTVVFGFILGIYLSKKLSLIIKKTTNLKFINFFV